MEGITIKSKKKRYVLCFLCYVYVLCDDQRFLQMSFKSNYIRMAHSLRGVCAMLDGNFKRKPDSSPI